jgi:putative ABC transport system permease protein
MTFFKLALTNLFTHRLRNVLTVLGIAISVVALYSIISFNKGFLNGLKSELEKTGLHFMVVPVGCPHEVASLVLHGAITPSYLDNEIAGKLTKIVGENISLLAPILVYQKPNRTFNRVDMIQGMEFSNVEKIKPWWKIKGRAPSGEDEILLGYDIAEHDKIQPGSHYVYPGERTFKVVGVLEKTSSKDDAFVYMSLTAAQQLLGKEGAVTAFGLRLKDPVMLSSVVEKLAKELPGIQIVTMSQVFNSISTLAASARVLSLSVVAIALIVGIVGVMNTVLMTVFERTQEIGMMRAVGASKSDIFRIILMESAILSGAGGIFGVLFALIFSPAVESFVKTFMPYVPQGKLITFNPMLFFLCFFFAVIAGTLAGFYPAWRAAKISPIEAIRS